MFPYLKIVVDMRILNYDMLYNIIYYLKEGAKTKKVGLKCSRKRYKINSFETYYFTKSAPCIT